MGLYAPRLCTQAISVTGHVPLGCAACTLFLRSAKGMLGTALQLPTRHGGCSAFQLTRKAAICYTQTAAALLKISNAVNVATWVVGIAAVWLAAAANMGPGVLGAGLGARAILAIPVPVWAAAVAVGLVALRSRVDAAYKGFHVPDRVGQYPLIRPASFSKPASSPQS